MTPDQKAREAAAEADIDALAGLLAVQLWRWREIEIDRLSLVDPLRDTLAALPLPPDVEAVCERLEHPGALHGQRLENQREAAALIRALQARLSGQ